MKKLLILLSSPAISALKPKSFLSTELHLQIINKMSVKLFVKFKVFYHLLLEFIIVINNYYVS